MSFKNTDLLTIELAPKKREELVIHKTKVNELSQWLQHAFPDASSPSCLKILFLTGPTGSGKSTCVEVLCKELRIELIDYAPEFLHNENLEFESADSLQLWRFLIKRHASFGSSLKKRVLLVSELPDSAYRDADNFRSELCETLQNIHHPVIFCLSNGIGNWTLNPDRIFNSIFLQENGIQQITFNPVAETFVTKALKRASTLLRLSVSDAKCQTLSSDAHGDLRLAINMLQMNRSQKRSSSLISTSKSNREETFHMIGRILYAKRAEDHEESGKKSKKRRTSAAQQKATTSPDERLPLEHDPTDIITMSSMSADKLTNFLFENELIFCSDISKYRHVIDMFSFCDAIGNDWSVKKSIPDEYEAQIVTRCVMWNNFQGSRPKSLYQVRRPTLTELNRELAVNRQEIRNLPMIGTKHFSSLTAPYRARIEGCFDPNRIETFVSRPFSIQWKLGRDRIVDQMEKWKSSQKVFRKKKENKIEEEKGETMEEVEETWTIEDSSDNDSFDDF